MINMQHFIITLFAYKQNLQNFANVYNDYFKIFKKINFHNMDKLLNQIIKFANFSLVSFEIYHLKYIITYNIYI